MSISLPSKEAIVVNVPEVRNFTAKFHYDFFVPDEQRVNSSEVPRNILQKPTDGFDAHYIDFIRFRVPRFVEFTFTPVIMQDKSHVTNMEDVRARAGTQRIEPAGIIRNNLSKIVAEDHFAAFGYVSVNFSDQSIDTKLHEFVSGSIAGIFKQVNDAEQQRSQAAAAAKAAANAAAQQQRNLLADAGAANSISTLVGQILQGQKAAANPPRKIIAIRATHHLKAFSGFAKPAAPTHHVILKKIAAVTPPEIRFNFLSRAYVQPSQSGAFFFENNTERQNESLEKLKDVAVKTQFNAKFMNKLVRTAMANPTITFGSDIENLDSIAKSVSKNAVQRTAQSITNDEYKTYVFPHDVCEAVTTTATTRTAFKILGYVIDRYSVDSDNQMHALDPIVIENPYVGIAVDLNVAYGQQYAYSVRTIAEFTVPAIDDDTDTVVVAKLLISSKATKPKFITCHDSTPPPSPTDFGARWDYTANNLMLSWTLPPNPQRDVKKIQIFRRKSIKEPFQLIRMLDFDDSEVPAFDNERVPDNLIDKLDDHRGFYVDAEFTKDSKFIYALASIDAHGVTSGYTEQFEITFNRFKNRIVKKLISQSGAPKQYPNMYVQADTFVDVMHDVNHTQVRIYFTPDFLQTYTNNGRVVPMVETDKTKGSYRLQFINMDLQEMAVVDINISDKRTRQDIHDELYQRRGVKRNNVRRGLGGNTGGS